MLVKSYEDDWFRDSIVKYLKMKNMADIELKDDKFLFNELFKKLNNMVEDDRDTEIDSIRRFINTGHNKHKNLEFLQKD